MVEFQPSAWSKGCYLNVAAHWLWSELGHLSFDFGNRVAGFVEFTSDDQFTPAVRHLTDLAAQEGHRLAQTFTSVGATAKVLVDEVQRTHEPGQGSWLAYHAAVAAALAGRREEAEDMFSRFPWSSSGQTSVLDLVAGRMALLVDKPAAFRSAVAGQIGSQRQALQLPALDSPLL